MPKLVVWVPFSKQGYVKASIDIPLGFPGGDGKAVTVKSLQASGQQTISCKLISNNKSMEVNVASILEYDQTHDHAMPELSSINSVNDAAILNTLYTRFKRGKFGAFVSPALYVALHPCSGKPLDPNGAVGEADEYQGLGAKERRGHLFHAVDEFLALGGKATGAHSAVLLGASASGKTHTGRRLLRFVLQRSAQVHGSVVADRARWLTTLLDAFGGAATPDNEESSRCCTVLTVALAGTGAGLSCTGVSACVFGLEAARLAAAGASEGGRNFHVLHQLVSGLEKSQLDKLLLTANPAQFRFLGRHSGREVVAAASLQQIVRQDALRLRGVRAALGQVVAASGTELAPGAADPSLEVLRLLAVVLHLGNMAFRSKHDGLVIEDLAEDPAPCEIVKSKFFYFIEDSLGLGSEGMRTGGASFEQVLTSRSMAVSGAGRSSLFTVELTARQTYGAACALAVELYARLFSWLVAAGPWGEATAGSGLGAESGIAVNIVDLCSFQLGAGPLSSALDPFHALLSNYCCEKLRDHCLSRLLDAELQRYRDDGLVPPDVATELRGAGAGRSVVALFEGAGRGGGAGLFAVLDDCCSSARGGGEGPTVAPRLVGALSAQLSASGLFSVASESAQPVGTGSPSKARLTAASARAAFSVRHFGGDVSYDATDFVAAALVGRLGHPMDKPLRQLRAMLARSANPLVRAIFAADADASEEGGDNTVSGGDRGLSTQGSDGVGIHLTTTATRRLSMAVQQAGKQATAGGMVARTAPSSTDSDAYASGAGGSAGGALGAGPVGRHRCGLERALQTLRESRSVQYVLCVRPNLARQEPAVMPAQRRQPAAAAADSVVFERELVLRQLRLYGVGAYARLRGDSPDCFPLRFTYTELHAELVARDLYAGSGVHPQPLTADVLCRKWVHLLLEEALPSGSWRAGQRLVWLKSTAFESLRLHKERHVVISLQRIWRGVLLRLKLYKYVSGVCALQRLVRRRRFFRRYHYGIDCAVVKLQSLARMQLILRTVNAVRAETLRQKSALRLQRMYRMYRAQMRVLTLLQYRYIAFAFNRWRLKRRLRFRAAAALVQTALRRREWRGQVQRVVAAAHAINRLGNACSCRISFLKLRAHVLKVQQRWRGFYIRRQAQAIVELIRVEKELRAELVSAVSWNDLPRLRALFAAPQYATALRRGEVDAATREKASLGGASLLHLAVDNCHRGAGRDASGEASLAVLRYLLESHRETVDPTAVDSLGRTVLHRLAEEQFSADGGAGRADMRLWTYLLDTVPSEVLLVEDASGATVLRALAREQRGSRRPMPAAEFDALCLLVSHCAETQPVKRRDARLVRRSWYVTSRFAAQNQGKPRTVRPHEYKPTTYKPFRPPSSAKASASLAKTGVVVAAAAAAVGGAPPRLATSRQPFGVAEVPLLRAPVAAMPVTPPKAMIKAKSKRKSVFAWANGSAGPETGVSVVPEEPPEVTAPAAHPPTPLPQVRPASTPVRVNATSSKLFGELSIAEDEDDGSGGFFTSKPFAFSSPAESVAALSPAEAVALALQEVPVVAEDLEADDAEALCARREERHRRVRAARDADAERKKLVAVALASKRAADRGSVSPEGCIVNAIPFSSGVSAPVEQERSPGVSSAGRGRVVRKHEDAYHPMLDVFRVRDC